MVYDLQKASFWKRTAAWMFDWFLIVVLVVGVAYLLSTVLHYDQYSDGVSDAYSRYEEEYGISFDITQEEYLTWSAEKQQAYDKAYEALLSDEQAMYDYNMVVNLTMVVASLSILAAILALEFAVPLILKNGQTCGKKIFGLCVIREDCVKMSTMQLFVRTVLGKFTIETMIPVYIVLMLFWGIADLTGTILLLALGLAEIICLLVTRRRAALHDLLAGTAVADLSSQMIFQNTEDLIEFQKSVHAERAARQDY